MEKIVNNSNAFYETLRCLKRDETHPNKYYLLEPHLLYLSDAQSKSYLKVMKNSTYSDSFHNPTISIINANLEQIFSNITENITFIDLGPGYPDKTLPIAKYFQRLNRQFHYYPVDISQTFLNIASETMEPFSSVNHPIQANFENCSELIPQVAYSNSVFIMLGVTCMNFELSFICPILKKLAKRDGKLILAAELITKRNTIENIVSSYRTDDNKDFALGPIKNLGISDLSNYEVIFKNNRVELIFTFKKPMTLHCHADNSTFSFNVGDKIVTAISYRYTLNELENLLSKEFRDFELYMPKDSHTALIIAKT
jgi:uncharacterized SAM-dependent methyltransferase